MRIMRRRRKASWVSPALRPKPKATRIVLGSNISARTCAANQTEITTSWAIVLTPQVQPKLEVGVRALGVECLLLTDPVDAL